MVKEYIMAVQLSPGIWSSGQISLGNPVRQTGFPVTVLRELWSGHGEIGPGSYRSQCWLRLKA